MLCCLEHSFRESSATYMNPIRSDYIFQNYPIDMLQKYSLNISSYYEPFQVPFLRIWTNAKVVGANLKCRILRNGYKCALHNSYQKNYIKYGRK